MMAAKVASRVAGDRERVTVSLLEGEGRWRVEFQSKAFYLRDSKGIRYLRTLVERPGQRVAVAEIASVEGCSEASVLGAERKLRARIEAIRDERLAAERSNDLGRRQSISAEAERLLDDLEARRRPVDRSGAERVRKSVAIAIHRAIAAIRRHQPLLAEHLAVSIRTGGSLSYVPDPLSGVRWHCRPRLRAPLRAVA